MQAADAVHADAVAATESIGGGGNLACRKATVDQCRIQIIDRRVPNVAQATSLRSEVSQ